MRVTVSRCRTYDTTNICWMCRKTHDKRVGFLMKRARARALVV